MEKKNNNTETTVDVVTEEEYKERERTGIMHRTLNSVLSVTIIVLLVYVAYTALVPLYERVSGLEQQRAVESEIAQIVSHEGYRSCRYKDSLGLSTIGFGHLITSKDKLPRCITPHESVDLLRSDYNIALQSVERSYPWATGHTRLVLTNLVFNMGQSRVGKFKNMLKALEDEDYDLAASELLDSRYANQVGRRASEMAGRIMALKGE